jgi:hypothetical protein
MKERAKKALRHDLEIAGKTVPTMLVAALFLIGGGSAALLTSFGTVSGTADVSQAVVFGQDGTEEGTTTLTDIQSSSFTAGDELVDSADLDNNRDEYVDVYFQSDQEFTKEGTSNGPDSEGDVEGLQTAFLSAYEAEVLENVSGYVRHGETDGHEGAGDSTAEVTFDEESGLAAVNVDTEFEGDTVSGGVKFDLSELDTEYDDFSSTQLGVDYRVSQDHRDGDSNKAPDWVIVKVDGEYYFDFTAYDSDEDGEYSSGLSGGDLNLVDESGDSIPASGEVEELIIASGTSDSEDPSGSGQDSDIYYHEVELGQHQLMTSVPHTVDESGNPASVEYSVPPGTTEVFVASQLDINAWPGDYTVTAEAIPESEQEAQ